MRIPSIALMGACCVLLAAGSAFASTEFVDRVPNGGANSCTTCHMPDFSELNGFGVDFLATNPSEPLWTTALANMDSDNDSFTNGTELLDPAGTWVEGDPDPGNQSLVSNPGDENSVVVEPATWGAIKDLFKE